jgi:hypothetical protein
VDIAKGTEARVEECFSGSGHVDPAKSKTHSPCGRKSQQYESGCPNALLAPQKMIERVRMSSIVAWNVPWTRYGYVFI